MWGSLCEDHILCQRSSARESNFGFSAPIRARNFALSAHEQKRNVSLHKAQGVAFHDPLFRGVTFRYSLSIRTLNFEESFSLRGLRFELSACRNTELNFEFCCPARVSAVPRFGGCCIARFSSTHSILSALYFSSPSTTSAVLRWLVMLVLSNLYRCMFIEFYFLSKYSNSIKRLTHKRNGEGCPSAASLSSSFARQILSILFDSAAVHSCSVHFNAGNFISEECHAFPLFTCQSKQNDEPSSSYDYSISRRKKQ